MINQDEVRSSFLLSNLKGISPAHVQTLVSEFGSSVKAVEAKPENWAALPNISGNDIAQFNKDFDRARRFADEEFANVEEANVRVLLWQSEDYPALLRHISSPPPLIYIKGNNFSKDHVTVALVGSRRCSYYGEKTARRLSAELATVGVTTVSGLARGIDTHVHRATMDAGGSTWAVLGCGLSTVYPPENKGLAEDIQVKGALVSEFPMQTKPYPVNFPRRNRLIAGLSLGTVVVEGSERSGSLITARLAGEEGREVFAVPGPITSPLSTAPHRLIQLGAKLVAGAADILEELHLNQPPSLSSLASAPSKRTPPVEYEKILEAIGDVPVPRETLINRLEKEAGNLSCLFLELELKGWIRSLPGGMVQKL